MTYSTIYSLDGYTIADGIQSQTVCDATIQTARQIAADRRQSVMVEDRGTRECYRITPQGRRLRAPKDWLVPTWGNDDC